MTHQNRLWPYLRAAAEAHPIPPRPILTDNAHRARDREALLWAVEGEKETKDV